MKQHHLRLDVAWVGVALASAVPVERSVVSQAGGWKGLQLLAVGFLLPGSVGVLVPLW